MGSRAAPDAGGSPDRTRPFGAHGRRCAAARSARSSRASVDHPLRLTAGARHRRNATRPMACRDGAGIGNNRVVWMDARAHSVRYARTKLELDVDLSDRTLALRRGATTVRRMSVGVGAFDSPTPTGRFSVTDKLRGADFSASYGCCILALSAVQPKLPDGWTGGDRIAIHGTPSASDFGEAVSAGCLHARDRDLRLLMRVVPLGTPVVIRP